MVILGEAGQACWKSTPTADRAEQALEDEATDY